MYDSICMKLSKQNYLAMEQFQYGICGGGVGFVWEKKQWVYTCISIHKHHQTAHSKFAFFMYI